MSSEQLTARPGVVRAYAASASALVAVLTAMVAQTEVLAGQVEQGFGQHPDVEIYRSQPGLGDDPRRPGAGRVRRRPRPLRRRQEPGRTTPACRRSPKPPAPNGSCWPATPATGASATRCSCRRSPRCADSPGARAFYDRHRARGATHYQALRALANRLVGILHGCLRHHTLYDEHLAWHTANEKLTSAA